MRKFFRTAVFAGAALGMISGAWGVDLTITGKKLLVKSKNGKEKLVFVSRDASIVAPTLPGIDAMVGLHPQALLPPWFFEPLDTVGAWSITGSGTVKYKDPGAPGTSACKVVIIKGGKLLKMVCKESFAPQPMTGPVAIQLNTGTSGGVRYCAQFNVATTNDINKYLAKDGGAPAMCPPASPSGAFLDSPATF